MLTPEVHAVCVLHTADDDAARLARVDAAADHQAHERRISGLHRALCARCCHYRLAYTA